MSQSAVVQMKPSAIECLAILVLFVSSNILFGQTSVSNEVFSVINSSVISGDYARVVELLDRDPGLLRKAMISLADRQFESIVRGGGEAVEDPAYIFRIATIAYGMVGRSEDARQLSDFRLDRVSRLRRIADLRTQLSIHLGDPGARKLLDVAENLQKPFSDSTNRIGGASWLETTNEKLGQTLYKKNCQNCHGETGDGVGYASRYLSPSPRALGLEPMRYVSAKNRRATDSDIERVIQKGLVGTSMPGFPQLNLVELQAVVRYIRFLQNQGMLSKFIELKDGETIDPQEKRDWAIAQWTPNEPVDTPSWTVKNPHNNELELTRGRNLFESSGCIQCHDSPGKKSQLFDSRGMPIHSRDFSVEPLRRGRDLSQTYLTIKLGLPGTPHPSSDLNDEQIELIANYVLSVTVDNVRFVTNVARRRLYAQKATN